MSEDAGLAEEEMAGNRTYMGSQTSLCLNSGFNTCPSLISSHPLKNLHFLSFLFFFFKNKPGGIPRETLQRLLCKTKCYQQALGLVLG